jgi:hypothetical protein
MSEHWEITLMDLIVEKTNEDIPIDLLLLSDPSEDFISEYINSSVKFIARYDAKIVGALLLLKLDQELWK